VTDQPQHILDGYKVLDFTQVLAGPTTTRLMVELGAEVIKLELAPTGDFARFLPWRHESGRSAYHVQQNRGKKSLCLDAKSEAGREIIRGLISEVDVVIENFAPGTIGRLGFPWETVHEINPRAVMCSLSAFGQTGPLANLPGYDYIAQAYAAVTQMIGDPDRAPAFPVLGIGDVMTGVHAAAAIGFALLFREKTGRGQYIDISLLDSYFHCHEVNIQIYSATKGEVEPTRSGSHHYAVCPLGLFKGKDRYMFIIALDHQWPHLCKAMGRPELVDDPRYDTNVKRTEKIGEVAAIIEEWLAGTPDDEAALRRLEECRVPCAPVLSIAEAVAHPHLRERQTIRRIEDRILGELDIPGMPLRFSEFPRLLDLEAPLLGEHNADVLGRHLGYEAGKIAELEAAGVLQHGDV
jgi:crotonobetainyl-CoA:carnitine CoA-transferase CaiB-like acyl-CoA transferase